MNRDDRLGDRKPGAADRPADEELVRLARGGDRAALSRLVERHRDRVYNLTLRMAGNPEDAEDRTQEILVKLITGLDSFQGRSAFSTWLYRIAVNHNLNARRNTWEKYFRSFEDHERVRNRLADDAADAAAGAEADLIAEETKSACLSGMLLCLSRRERIVLILGAIFNLDSATAARIMDATPAGFRQALSRARKRLAAFLDANCGLFNPANPCRCGRKARAGLRMGIVGRRGKRLGAVGEFVREHRRLVDDALALRLRDTLRGLPYYRSPAFDDLVRRFLDSPGARNVINFESGNDDAQRSG